MLPNFKLENLDKDSG